MIVRRALLAAPLAFAAPALAQGEFPARPVRVIVPFPPGQAADLFARLVADEISKRWPQRMVVENRAGGAGAIGMEAVKTAPADGYTLGIGTSGTLGINPSVMARLPYDAERDFSAITNIFTLPLIFCAHPSFEANDMAALVALARRAPNTVQYASAGPGTAQHLTAEMFAHRLNLQMQHVPYRGSGPAMADLIAGNVKIMVDSLASALPNVQGGRIKALAVTGAQRAPQLPNVPTVAETVSPGFAAAGWSGFVAPAGTPAAVIAKINADVVAILREPAIAARIVELGGTPDPGTPEEYARFIASEIAKWREVARAANVRLDG
jgi:tripartite-type tricarboxylate transporter receptor subunit TctC